MNCLVRREIEDWMLLSVSKKTVAVLVVVDMPARDEAGVVLDDKELLVRYCSQIQQDSKVEEEDREVVEDKVKGNDCSQDDFDDDFDIEVVKEACHHSLHRHNSRNLSEVDLA